MIEPGCEWGSATRRQPDLVVRGGDAALATAVAANPGALVRFVPDTGSDLAAAVGLRAAQAAGDPNGWEVPMDALRLGTGALAVNSVVLLTPPARVHRLTRRIAVAVEIDGQPFRVAPLTTLVVANGPLLAGAIVVPRGHPGDGRCEVQMYALGARERRESRARLGRGTHVPHPRILQRQARRVHLRFPRPVPIALDGVARGRVRDLTIEVVPGLYRLLL